MPLFDAAMSRWVLHLILFAAVLSGCAPLLHAPNAHPVPLFQNPGEVHAWARLGNPIVYQSDEQFTGGVDGELQVAFSPLNYLSVFTSAAAARRPKHRHHFGEIGIGTYVQLNKLYRSELLVGHGRGQIKTEGEYIDFIKGEGGTYEVTADYRRSFAQLNVGRELFSDAVAGAIVKVSDVQMHNLARDARLEGDARGLYLEPAWFVRGGVGAVGFEQQVGFTFPLHEANMDSFRSRRFYLSVGIHVKVESLYKSLGW